MMKRCLHFWCFLLFGALPVVLSAQPANDLCGGAVPITPSPAGTGCTTATFTLPFSTDGTTDSGVDGSCNGANTGLDQWFTWTATTDGLLFQSDNLGGPGIVVYDACGGTEISCVQTIQYTPNVLSGWAVGDALLIQIYDFGTSVSDVAFCLEEYTLPPAVANDLCANATPVSDGGSVSVAGPTATGTFGPGNTDSGEGAFCGSGTYAGGDIFFSYEAGAASIGVDLLTTTGSPYLEVYAGSCGALVGTEVYCSNFLSTSSTELIGGLTVGETYIFRIFENNNDAIGDITFTVTTLPPPPANDVCTGAIPADVGAPQSCFTGSTGANSYSVDFGTVTDSGDGTPDCDGSTNYDLWYTWTATSDKLQFSSGTGAPGIQLYTGSCGALTLVTGGCLNNTGGIIENLTVGTEYIIQIWDDSQGVNPVEWCLAEGPQCINPSGISFSNLTGTSVDFEFTSNNTGATPSVLVCPGGATTGCTSFTGTTTGTTATVNVTGLTGGTPYDAYAQDDCGSSQSQFVGPVSFTTLNEAPEGPAGVTCTSGGNSGPAYADPLDDLSAWTGDIGTSGGQWRSGSSTVSSNTGAGSPQSGSGFIYYEGSGGAGVTGAIVTGPIDLSSFQDDAELSFFIHAFGGYIGTFNVGIGTAAAGPFTNVYSSTGQFQSGSADPFLPVGVNIGSYVGQTIYIQLEHTSLTNGTGSNWTSDFSVDNLAITACVPAGVCSDPSGVSAINLGGGSVEVTFAGSSSAVSYLVEYGTTGFTPGTGTTTSGTGSPVTVTGLNGNTSYDFYVTADCDFGTSAQAGPATVVLGPNNDFCGGAIPITPSPAGTGCTTATFTLPFSTDGTTDSGVDGSCNGVNTGLDQWFTWTATTDGLLFQSDNLGGPGIVVYDACGGTEISCVQTIQYTPNVLSGWTVGDALLIQIYDFGTSVSDVAFCLEEYTLAPPVADLPAGCGTTITETVDGSGTPAFVDFLDANGGIVMSIENSQNLGAVAATLYGNTGTVRMQGGEAYADRNIAVVPTTQPTQALTVRYYMTSSEMSSFLNASPAASAPTDLVATKVDGTTTCSATYPGGGTEVPTGVTAYNSDWQLAVSVSSFSEFFFSAAGALPAELVAFTGTAQAQANRLDWTTATELNVDRFFVERSTNGADWITLGDVTATGDSDQKVDYTYLDRQPLPVAYYRLRTVDFDGYTEYSEVVQITRARTTGGVSLAPNPTRGEAVLTLDLSTAEDLTLTVTDLTGRVVLREAHTLTEGLHTLRLDLTDRAAGVYFVQLQSRTLQLTERLVKD